MQIEASVLSESDKSILDPYILVVQLHLFCIALLLLSGISFCFH